MSLINLINKLTLPVISNSPISPVSPLNFMRLRAIPFDPTQEVTFFSNKSLKSCTLLNNYKNFPAGTKIFFNSQGEIERGELHFAEEFIPPPNSPLWKTVGAVPKGTTFHYKSDGTYDLEKIRDNNHLFSNFFTAPFKIKNLQSFGTYRRRNGTHFGVDIKGRKGEQIKAPLPGIVYKINDDPISGLYVVFKNSGDFSTPDNKRDGLDIFVCHLLAVGNIAVDRLNKNETIKVELVENKNSEPSYQINLYYKNKFEVFNYNEDGKQQSYKVRIESVTLNYTRSELNSCEYLSKAEKNHINYLIRQIDIAKKFPLVPGQTIRQGQVLGLLGNSGHSTGPHLHLEYRLNTNYEVNGLIANLALQTSKYINEHYQLKGKAVKSEVFNKTWRDNISQQEISLNYSLISAYYNKSLNRLLAQAKTQPRHAKVTRKQLLTINSIRANKNTLKISSSNRIKVKNWLNQISFIATNGKNYQVLRNGYVKEIYRRRIGS